MTRWIDHLAKHLARESTVVETTPSAESREESKPTPKKQLEEEHASRRRFVQGTAVTAAALGAMYVKPAFNSFGVPVALAASGPPPPPNPCSTLSPTSCNGTSSCGVDPTGLPCFCFTTTEGTVQCLQWSGSFCSNSATCTSTAQCVSTFGANYVCAQNVPCGVFGGCINQCFPTCM